MTALLRLPLAGPHLLLAALLLTACPATDDDDSAPPDYGAAPTASVTIIPSAPTTVDDLVASVASSDPEGAVVQLTLRWLLDGDAAADHDGSFVVPAAATSAGQQWTVEVIPSDGGQDGEPASTTVTIGNTPPALTSVTILPEDPREGTDVVATPGTTSDVDGDDVTITFEWWVAGATVDGVTGDTLTSDDFDKGDLIQVLATPLDAEGAGTPVASNVVTGANTAPTAGSATITAVARDPAWTCEGSGWVDPDPADVEGYIYSWTVNFAFNVPGQELDDSMFSPGDTLVCQAVPFDGTDTGPAITSEPVEVPGAVNTPPVLAGVSLLPLAPQEGDDVVATLGATADAEGDTVTVSWEWSINGIIDPAIVGDTLTSADFDKGDAIQVVAVPDDGVDEGLPVASNVVTVINTPPTGADVAATPTSGDEGTTFTCAGSGWSDPDPVDTEGWEYAWTVNFAFTLPGDTIDGAHFGAGDILVCQATPTDGEQAGAALLTDPIMVDNTAPEAGAVALDPTAPTTTDPIVAAVTGVSDLDGDPVELVYAWTIDGAPAGGDSDTLDPSLTTKGDDVMVEVTPWDAQVAGAPVSSAPVTVLNTPPELASAAIEFDPGTGLFTATPAGWADLDGDAEAYVYAWSDGSAPVGTDAPTLDAGLVGAGATVTVDVTAFDGEDNGNTVTSNAIDYLPALSLQPTELDLGSRDLGCLVTEEVALLNLGIAPLEVSLVDFVETAGAGHLSAAWDFSLPATIEAGGQLVVEVTWDVYDLQDVAGELTVTSDDPAAPTAGVPVFGTSHWSAPVAETLLVIEEALDAYVLADIPIDESIEVYVDLAPHEDWTYDPLTNAVTFDDDEPEAGDVVEFTYSVWGLYCGTNGAPTAIATVLTASPEVCGAVVVDASGSSDPDGDPLEFDFGFVAVPAASGLDESGIVVSGSQGTLAPDEEGDYTVDVVATDPFGASSEPAEVSFTVGPDSGAPNQPPVANPGPAIVVTAETYGYVDNYFDTYCNECTFDDVMLDGGLSWDPEGGAVTWAWSMDDGDGDIEGDDEAQQVWVSHPEFSPENLGVGTEEDVVLLQVTDCQGETGTATVTIVWECTCLYGGGGGPS